MPCRSLPSPSALPPNILFVLADDLGTPPVRAYGNSFYQTPHLDRMAREGIRFTDAYSACPVCSPTRAAIMTGQYPARTHVTDFIGLRERTLVIFYSDNGGLLTDAAQTPWRRGKTQLYEGGIRVPLILRWPGVIAPGRLSAMPVTSVDFLPTLLEIAGRPAGPRITLDGISLARHLRGGSAPIREAIYWHYPHYHSAGDGGPAGAIRTGDWKLIEYYEHTLTGQGRAPELFNLRDDPAETHNLASSEPSRAKDLLGMLAQFRVATGAQMPTVNRRLQPRRPRRNNIRVSVRRALSSFVA